MNAHALSPQDIHGQWCCTWQRKQFRKLLSIVDFKMQFMSFRENYVF